MLAAPVTLSPPHPLTPPHVASCVVTPAVFVEQRNEWDTTAAVCPQEVTFGRREEERGGQGDKVRG